MIEPGDRVAPEENSAGTNQIRPDRAPGQPVQSPISTASPNAVSVESPRRHPVRELVDVWGAGGDTGTWIDAPADANRLTTELVARAGFGHSFNRLGDAVEDPFITTV